MREEGLEPSRGKSPPDPKSGASTIPPLPLEEKQYFLKFYIKLFILAIECMSPMILDSVEFFKTRKFEKGKKRET